MESIVSVKSGPGIDDDVEFSAKIFVLTSTESKKWFKKKSVCILLCGPTANAKSTEPILLKWSQNLYIRSEYVLCTNRYFEQFKKSTPF